MNKYSKKAFSFVEVIIVISIIVLLAVIAMNIGNKSQENVYNAKNKSDIDTLNNSFLSYYEENKELPMPGGNNNFFNIDGTYAHSFYSDESFGVYGYITESILPKKYLNYLPLDAKTNQFYAYGKTKLTNEFQIAGIMWENEVPETKIVGNYLGNKNLLGIIREYNGPNFLTNKSKTNFPYNPEERLLTAKISDYTGNVTINGDATNILEKTLVMGDKIEVAKGGYANLYFSDGSKSTLGDSTQSSTLELTDMIFKEENNLITKIKLMLTAGTLWTQATHLEDESEFDVFTSYSAAAVRGTVFGVQKNNSDTNITLEVGKIEVSKNNEGELSPITTTNENITTEDGKTYLENQLSDDPKGINIKSDSQEVIENNLVESSSLSNLLLDIKKITKNEDETYTTYTINLASIALYKTASYLKINPVYETSQAGTNDYTIDPIIVYRDPTNENPYQYVSTQNLYGTLEFSLCRKISIGETEKESCTKSVSVNLNTLEINGSVSLDNTITDSVTALVEQCIDGQTLINGICVDITTNLVDEAYSLVAYAPYDIEGDLNMYDTGSNIISILSKNILYDNNEVVPDGENNDSNDSRIYDKTNSFYNGYDFKGIFIDNNNDNPDSLKYDLKGLDLGDNFIIEIGVRKEKLLYIPLNDEDPQYGTVYKIFEMKPSNIKLLTLNENIALFEKTTRDNLKEKISCSKNICPVRLINNGGIYSIDIDGEKIILEGNKNNTLINDYLYIGGGKYATQQWNDIIDYVKIYKK